MKLQIFRYFCISNYKNYVVSCGWGYKSMVLMGAYYDINECLLL